MVSLISRFYSIRGKPLRNKVGGPIVVARRAGHNFTFAQLMFFFMISEMIVPGSTYWNVAFGRSKGDVTKDEEGVRTIKNFGQKLAWLAKKINA
jgi:multimeric flavodoxin WrbA